MTERRVLLAALIAFVAIGGFSTFMLATAPGADATGDAVVAWFGAYRDQVRWAVCAGAIGCVFFAALLAILRASLPAVSRDVFLVGGVLLMAMGAVQYWVSTSRSSSARRSPAPGSR
jgi:hypothetical protein